MNGTPTNKPVVGKIAPAPKSGSYVKDVYDLLKDMGDWTTISQLSQLIHFTKPKRKGKEKKNLLKAALYNGVYRGYFLTRKVEGSRSYRIAPYDHYFEKHKKIHQREMDNYRRRNPSSQNWRDLVTRAQDTAQRLQQEKVQLLQRQEELKQEILESNRQALESNRKVSEISQIETGSEIHHRVVVDVVLRITAE